MEKVFVSDKIAKVVQRHVPNDGIALTKDLTVLFTELLVQVANNAIHLYINNGVNIERS